MPRPSALCLLLACLVSLTAAAVVLENGMPILWAQTASQLTDLPAQNGVVTPDPWHYLHRMSLYRLMIAATDPFMGSLGDEDDKVNAMWGMTVELGWFLTSGRLVDPTGATTCGQQTGDPMCISPQSWSGCITYFLSVLSFLSAAQQGFLGEGVQVQMQVPAGVQDYCTTYVDCSARYPDVMAKWDAYYQGLKASTDSPLADNEKKDAILGLYWAAHLASLHASPTCSAKLNHYSAPEVSFITSSLTGTEFIAASHMHFSLEKANIFAVPLPSRVLREGDKAPNIADLSAEENHTVSVFSWMKRSNSMLGGLLPSMWRGAMCSVSNREKGRETLEQLILNPSFATSTLMSIIYGMATGC